MLVMQLLLQAHEAWPTMPGQVVIGRETTVNRITQVASRYNLCSMCYTQSTLYPLSPLWMQQIPVG